MGFKLEEKLKANPDIIRRYLQTGHMPHMTAEEKKRFLNYMELFRTIQLAGMLDNVLGSPELGGVLEMQMEIVLMAYNTAIDWCETSWNPSRGCTRVSKGCERCYAERIAHEMSRGIPRTLQWTHH